MASDLKTVRWYGPRVRKLIRQQLEYNLDRVGIMLENDIKRSFGSSGVTGKRSGATAADRHKNRSAPWSPPNVDTGHLKRSVGYIKPAPLRRWIGTGLGSKEKSGYAKYLEFGTRPYEINNAFGRGITVKHPGIKPRPFLRPALHRNRSRINRILGRKLR